MNAPQPRSGYTLPVFACAAAIAALRWLQHPESISTVLLDLLNPATTVEIPIEQVAGLKAGAALAITRSDPGDNLDLTHDTPIWAIVEWGDPDQPEPILITGGEGIGHHRADGNPAIYTYAHRLILHNLQSWLEPGQTIQVQIILPDGRALAQRTSNAAFGVVEGLSLLGTSGISQPLSAPGQLTIYRETLQQKVAQFDSLVFCIGENGLDLIQQIGVDPSRLIKTANWLGPLLVEAGFQGVPSILLFGYHGKLIKLAAGIFHTHHHVADGRIETLTAHCAKVGIPSPDLQKIFICSTAEDVLRYLKYLDAATETQWVRQVYESIAEAIDQRAQTYVQIHSDRPVAIGSILFDRDRNIIAKSKIGADLLEHLLLG